VTCLRWDLHVAETNTNGVPSTSYRSVWMNPTRAYHRSVVGPLADSRAAVRAGQPAPEIDVIQPDAGEISEEKGDRPGRSAAPAAQVEGLNQPQPP